MPIEKIQKSREEQAEDFAKMVELRGGKYCNKCFDRGYNGWDVKYEFYIPCDCLLKAASKIEQQKLAERKLNAN
jgi:hypothetical protein